MKPYTKNRNSKWKKIKGMSPLLCLTICLMAALAGCAQNLDSSAGTAADTVTESSKEGSTLIDSESSQGESTLIDSESPQGESALTDSESSRGESTLTAAESSKGEPTTAAADSSSTVSSENESKSNSDLDNFSVDGKEVRAFAEKVQTAVQNEDLEGLSSLMTFPNYVSIYTQNNGVVKSEKEFLSLGKEKIFTDQLKASIANADLDALKPSMAGFVLVSADQGSAPSITFGIQHGELRIVGMNY